MPTTDPDRFKRIKGRIKEYRVSHPQVFTTKGEQFAGRLASIVVEEFKYLVEEHKGLVESGLTLDDKEQKKANAAYERLETIWKENQSVIEQNGFIKQVDSQMLRDMVWLCDDIERLARMQPVEQLAMPE